MARRNELMIREVGRARGVVKSRVPMKDSVAIR